MSNSAAIAIVGAGFSGTLVATHLLRQVRFPLTIYLIERNPDQYSRGVAYSTSHASHLLNVPGGNMSAFPDDPQHFLRWAQARDETVTAASFLPRQDYGLYLQGLLAEAIVTAPADVNLVHVADTVMALSLIDDKVELHLAHDLFKPLRMHKAVLALGNFTPGNPAVRNTDFYQSDRYHGNPWEGGVFDQVLSTASCLLVGSGLTMVDWAISLQQAGYRGIIHTLSRRGLWPQAHQKVEPTNFTLDPQTDKASVRAWLHALHQHVRVTGCDWRAAIDALRPNTPTLWNSLPDVEQRRFLRHLRPYWDCHRHRLAPEIAAQLEQLYECGRLVRHTGRILDYQEQARDVVVTLRRRGSLQTETLQVEAVVNCSGSESDYRRLDDALVRNLLDQGLARPDALALGLDVAPDGALIGADNTVSSHLFTLGPPQKGVWWETTAVPEIRGQAARLAALLISMIKAKV